MLALPKPCLIGDNIVVSSGKATALFRMHSPTYSWSASGVKQQIARDLVNLIEAAGADLSIYRIARAVDPAAYIDQARASADPVHGKHARWEELIRRHAEQIDGAWYPEAYLAVRLQGQAPGGFGSGLTRRVDQLRVAVESAVRRGSTISDTEREHLKNAERVLREKLCATGADLTPIGAPDLAWLLRRAAARGGASVHAPVHGPAHEPTLDCRITEHARHLEIDHDTGTAFQSFLALGSVPEEVQFPGAAAEALHHPLATLDVPVDVACHMEWVAPNEALSLVRKRVVDAHNVLGEEAQAEIGASWKAP